MSAKPIVVLGAGGLARETMWLIEAINGKSSTYRVLGYLDDDTSKHGRTLCDYAVLGGFDLIANCGEDRLCVALGVGEPGPAAGQARQGASAVEGAETVRSLVIYPYQAHVG